MESLPTERIIMLVYSFYQQHSHTNTNLRRKLTLKWKIKKYWVFFEPSDADSEGMRFFGVKNCLYFEVMLEFLRVGVFWTSDLDSAKPKT